MDNVIRIVLARKATPKEKEEYEVGQNYFLMLQKRTQKVDGSSLFI